MTAAYRFGSFELQPDQRRLLVDGRPAALGPRAFDVLLALVERAGQLVSKNQLLDLAWAGLVVEENNLQVQVSALRRILGPEAIATIPGRGYRFTLPLGETPPHRTESTPAPEVGPPRAAALTASRAPDLSQSRLATNLPLHLPPLIGREDDLRQVRLLVREHSLLTLVGAGGIGKTRLAHAVAHEELGHYAGGVWLVELASVSDPASVGGAVAQALGVALDGRRAVKDVLVDAVRDQNLLLVLDNCEHLVEPVAALAEALLRSAPGVTLLATSQEPLRLAKEHQYRLGTLAVPDGAGVDDAASYGAVALFVDRARVADPHFSLNAENRAAVIDICRRLDGIALAIELAAARVGLLGANGLRDRLKERFRLLTAGSRFALRRHQTLRAALDWSHSLLSTGEQAVFRRLGVFAGGFTLDAAQELAADDGLRDEWSVLDHLGALVDKSLVVAETGATPRYHLLETTRAYALEQLAHTGETRAIVERHAKVTLGIFERAEEDRFGEQGSISWDAFIQRVWQEFDNLRAALAWAMAEEGEAATAIALAAASAEGFANIGLSPEGLGPLLALQDRVDDSVDPKVAARFWHNLGYLGSDGRIALQATLDACAKAEHIYRQLDSPRRLYRTLIHRAWVLALGNRAAEAEGLLREIRRLEDSSWPGWLRGTLLNLRGLLFTLRGQHADALAVFLEWQSLLPATGEGRSRLSSMVNQCVALSCTGQFAKQARLARLAVEACRRDRLNDSMGFALGHLLASLTALGLLDEAREALREAVPYWRRDGLVPVFCEYAALLVARLGRHADAARLAGARNVHRERSGVTPYANEKLSRADLLECFAAAHVNPEDIERWMQEGAHLDVNGIVALCLDEAAAAR